ARDDRGRRGATAAVEPSGGTPFDVCSGLSGSAPCFERRAPAADCNYSGTHAVAHPVGPPNRTDHAPALGQSSRADRKAGLVRRHPHPQSGPNGAPISLETASIPVLSSSRICYVKKQFNI